MSDTPTRHSAASLADLAEQLVAAHKADGRMQHIDATFLPSRARAIDIIELLRQIMFPGFFDDVRLTSDSVAGHLTDLLTQLHDLLYEQVRQALRYDLNRAERGKGDLCDQCDELAGELTDKFLASLPELGRILADDVQASFDGDPAAVSTDETIFCYPGLDAIFIYRIAHRLCELKVPLLPRIMSEYAHNETGVDIHPGATIGKSFFIDHGTGVVIGETTIIGDCVKVYQGVTLGALSTKGGQSWRGRKRHPTIEDRVTIYPNATILGGETVIGENSVVNGSVFVIDSVPPNTTVGIKHPELRLRQHEQSK